jgi:hypothetical protein
MQHAPLAASLNPVAEPPWMNLNVARRRWPSGAHSATRESALRSYAAAPAASKGCINAASTRSTDAPVVAANHEDHRAETRRDESLRALSGCAARRLAPRAAAVQHHRATSVAVPNLFREPTS